MPTPQVWLARRWRPIPRGLCSRTAGSGARSLPMSGALDIVREAGKWVFAGGLEPIEATTGVDGRGESPVITDGPFSESKEYLGGFWIIEAADLDEALDWAARGSKACRAKVEVRPFDAA